MAAPFLEAYPLTLLIKNVRDPLAQPGLPDETSLGGGTLVSPASSASEQVNFLANHACRGRVHQCWYGCSAARPLHRIACRVVS